MEIKLLEFIGVCNLLNLTPDDKHIKAFLNSCGSHQYLNKFIKYCFYYWEERSYDTNLINKQLQTLN